MAVDTSVFGNIKTLQDFQRANEQFQIERQIAQQKVLESQRGANLPAPIQLANEVARLRAMGNDSMANSIEQFAKINERGVVLNPDGTYTSAPGYDSALANRGALVKGAEQTAKNIADVTYKPNTIDTGAGIEIYDPSIGGTRPIAPKGLTPQQQEEKALKERAERDSFNRGLEVKEKALAAVDRLLANPSGVRANRGLDAMLPNVLDTSMDAAADLETVSNLLTTENLGLLKGVLSDTDMRVLASIGSGELQGSDDKVLGALGRMKTALSGKVANMQQYKGQSGMPPLSSDIPTAPNPNVATPPVSGIKFLGFE